MCKFYEESSDYTEISSSAYVEAGGNTFSANPPILDSIHTGIFSTKNQLNAKLTTIVDHDV